MSLATLGAPAQPAFAERIWRINFGLILVLTAIAAVGVVALYSAAGGRFEPWAARHAVRYAAALGLLLVVALVHPKVWLSLLTWTVYAVCMYTRIAGGWYGAKIVNFTIAGFVLVVFSLLAANRLFPSFHDFTL